MFFYQHKNWGNYFYHKREREKFHSLPSGTISPWNQERINQPRMLPADYALLKQSNANETSGNFKIIILGFLQTILQMVHI